MQTQPWPTRDLACAPNPPAKAQQLFFNSYHIDDQREGWLVRYGPKADISDFDAVSHELIQQVS
jgi:hypothetical protein